MDLVGPLDYVSSSISDQTTVISISAVHLFLGAEYTCHQIKAPRLQSRDVSVFLTRRQADGRAGESDRHGNSESLSISSKPLYLSQGLVAGYLVLHSCYHPCELVSGQWTPPRTAMYSEKLKREQAHTLVSDEFCQVRAQRSSFMEFLL